jgi:glycosyltransferase involved in cell wall biosynthesis
MHLFLNCLAASAGGGLTYARNIIPHLSACSGVKVTVAIHPRLRAEVEAGGNISFAAIDVPSHAGLRFCFEQARLPRMIRQSRADVLISTGNFALRRSPVPQILLSGNSLYISADFFHDLRRRREYGLWFDTRLRGYFARRSIHWADRTVAPSQSFAEQLRKWARSDVSWIHHGFDPEIFFRDRTALSADIQAKLESGAGKLRLLFVSHYNYYRNFETLLRAMPRLAQRLGPDNVRLYLTCELLSEKNPGSFDPSTARHLIRELGIRDQVVELGAIPYQHLHKVYQACNIYVTPAYTETFAYPLVEAMACGLPIVASDLPVHREITAGAAQFFPAFSAEELAERVLLLAQSPKLGSRQAEAGRQRAAEFSWAKHVDALMHLAEALVSRGE